MNAPAGRPRDAAAPGRRALDAVRARIAVAVILFISVILPGACSKDEGGAATARAGPESITSRTSISRQVATRPRTLADHVALARGGYDYLASTGVVVVTGKLTFGGSTSKAAPLTASIFVNFIDGPPKVLLYTENPEQSSRIATTGSEGIRILRSGTEPVLQTLDPETTADLLRKGRIFYILSRLPLGGSWVESRPNLLKNSDDGSSVQLTDEHLPSSITTTFDGVVETWHFEGALEKKRPVAPARIIAKARGAVLWTFEIADWNVHARIHSAFWRGGTSGAPAVPGTVDPSTGELKPDRPK